MHARARGAQPRPRPPTPRSGRPCVCRCRTRRALLQMRCISRRIGTVIQPTCVVSLVYGSFDKGYAVSAANRIHAAAPAGGSGLQVRGPKSGDDFDFDSLQDTDFLVICASSQNGFPPRNLVDFAHQLLLAVETGDPECFAHMRHAVWGEGDPRWLGTFMNVPRFIDLLLEECGSTRFYARGEAQEPHAPSSTVNCEVDDWAPGMWQAALHCVSADAATASAPVPWDAQWAAASSAHHHDIRAFDLETLVRRYGELKSPPSRFAHVDEPYKNMLAAVRREQETQEQQRRARMAARAASQKTTRSPSDS